MTSPYSGGVSIIVIPIEPHVVRLQWKDDFALQGLSACVAQLRQTLADVLVEPTTRVEVHVSPTDAAMQRIVSWAGFLREGTARGVANGADRIVYSRTHTDLPFDDPGAFRAALNSFLPRKRAIGQYLLRSTEGQVLLCELTYKQDWDLPGGVVEVGEAPQLAATREVFEELGLRVVPGQIVLVDWLPPWGGWDDAVCLVFDGGTHPVGLLPELILQAREIKAVHWVGPDQLDEVCADFTARRIRAALAAVEQNRPLYTESGRLPQ